jgi:Na+/phosphate symporter
MSVYVSLAIAVLGIVLYLVGKTAELKELGRIGFAVGLVTFLLLWPKALTLH